jgi:hypothetical protein
MVTADFKKLIKIREAAFSSGNDSLFKHSPNRMKDMPCEILFFKGKAS